MGPACVANQNPGKGSNSARVAQPRFIRLHSLNTAKYLVSRTIRWIPAVAIPSLMGKAMLLFRHSRHAGKTHVRHVIAW